MLGNGYLPASGSDATGAYEPSVSMFWAPEHAGVDRQCHLVRDLLHNLDMAHRQTALFCRGYSDYTYAISVDHQRNCTTGNVALFDSCLIHRRLRFLHQIAAKHRGLMLECPSSLGRFARQMLADTKKTARARAVDIHHLQIIAGRIVKAKESEIAWHYVSQHCAHAVEHRGCRTPGARYLIHFWGSRRIDV